MLVRDEHVPWQVRLLWLATAAAAVLSAVSEQAGRAARAIEIVLVGMAVAATVVWVVSRHAERLWEKTAEEKAEAYLLGQLARQVDEGSLDGRR